MRKNSDLCTYKKVMGGGGGLGGANIKYLQL